MNKILKSACSAFAIGCATCIGFGVATSPNEVYGMGQDVQKIEKSTKKLKKINATLFQQTRGKNYMKILINY